MTFDNVYTDVSGGLKAMASHALLTINPGPMNLHASGDDVKVTGDPGKGSPNSCANKFVPFPGR
jgi:hypothetical protein